MRNLQRLKLDKYVTYMISSNAENKVDEEHVLIFLTKKKFDITLIWWTNICVTGITITLL